MTFRKNPRIYRDEQSTTEGLAGSVGRMARQLCHVAPSRFRATGYSYLGAAKSDMKMLGIDGEPARLPNANPPPEQVVKLRRELKDLGFFEWIGSAKSQPALSR